MNYVPQNQHARVLLLSLLITLFFSLPSLATLGIETNEDNAAAIALQRFLILLVLNYLLVVPLFYANLLGRPLLRATIPSSVARFFLIGISNIILIMVLTRTTIAIQQRWLAEVTWIGQLRGVYLFRNLIILGIVLLTVYIIELFQRSQRMYVENARLREENIETQLAVLKAQINPHFLFNSLNSLSALIRTDRDESLQFVQRLSEVFRYSLQHGRQNLVTVQEELQGLDAYFFMLKKRFGNKIDLRLQVDEAAYRRYLPPLALQVLVENAVKHNVITTACPLVITIASVNQALLVTNNRHDKRTAEESYGIGLANLNQRYQLIARQTVLINKDEDTFSVTLPLLQNHLDYERSTY